MRHLFLAESDYAAGGAAFHHAMRVVGEESRYMVASLESTGDLMLWLCRGETRTEPSCPELMEAS